MIRRLGTDAVLETIGRRLVAGGREVPPFVAPVHAEDPSGTQAYRSGYAQGFEAGEQDGLRTVEAYKQQIETDARARLDAALQDLSRERERLASCAEGLGDALDRYGAALEDMAFEIALASLARSFGEMSGDHALLRRLCTQMVEEHRAKAVSLRVSTGDRAVLPEHISGLEVIEDAGLADGECRIETSHGHVETSMAMRLEAIVATMLDTLRTTRP
ncbi:FliH/SctL family protein [Dyella sp. S184]|uniref:FliH/SctL family protein n=1 Tax=Dyella sp. S184 TaxID=1641862 RepID=UPI00131D8F8E|nr:FliH/SctL family protein [Dyella sp. S184]